MVKLKSCTSPGTSPGARDTRQLRYVTHDSEGRGMGSCCLGSCLRTSKACFLPSAVRIREFIISPYVRGENRTFARMVDAHASLLFKKVHAEQSPFSLESCSDCRAWSNLVWTIQVWRELVAMGSILGHDTMRVCVE